MRRAPAVLLAAALVAGGAVVLAPSAPAAVTGAAPVPKVSNLKGRTVTRFGTVAGIPTMWRNGVLTYTLTGAADGIQIVSQSNCANNGALYDIWEADGEIEFGSRTLGFCTLKLRPYNASGYGATVSLTFI